MGYIIHESIIVTSWDDDGIARAHAAAKLSGLPVSDIYSAPLNGFRSFCVLPDGSKEGWDDAVQYEAHRKALIARLRAIGAYEDGSSCVDFCCVRWGEDSTSIATSRREMAQTARLVSCYLEPGGSVRGLATVPVLANHDAVRDRLTETQAIDILDAAKRVVSERDRYVRDYGKAADECDALRAEVERLRDELQAQVVECEMITRAEPDLAGVDVRPEDVRDCLCWTTSGPWVSRPAPLDGPMVMLGIDTKATADGITRRLTARQRAKFEKGCA